MAKSMDEWTLTLGKRIITANSHNRFISVITRGERGYGKSMYNLKCMAFVFHTLYNLSEKDAWLKALDNIFFSPYEYMKRIEYNYLNNKIDPVWCLDDAGVHFTGMMFFRSPHLYGLIDGSFDTLRTVTNSLLVNCPYKNKLMKGLQQYDDREITLYIAQNNGYDRKAVCIKWYRLPSGKREWFKDFEDEFSCYVPNWVYKLYLEKRRRFNKEIVDEWKVNIKKLEMKKP